MFLAMGTEERKMSRSIHTKIKIHVINSTERCWRNVNYAGCFVQKQTLGMICYHFSAGYQKHNSNVATAFSKIPAGFIVEGVECFQDEPLQESSDLYTLCVKA